MPPDLTVKFGEGAEDFRQAEWLAQNLGGAWRYDFTAKHWHGWNGAIWAEDQTSQITNAVATVAAEHAGKTNSEVVRKALLKLHNLPSINRALEALATFDGYGTDGSDWDQVPYLLGCNNGVVDLRTNRLNEHPEPTTLVTKTTKQDFVAIKDPSEFETRAPLFIKFMREIMSSDAEMVGFLLMWFGSSLFGFSPEQRFLLMTGIGRNGKGALRASIMEAVGDYGVQPNANVYMRSKLGGIRSDAARADLLDLKGKRIGFFSEPEGNRFNEEMLKAHTGGDVITARQLYSGTMVSWEPTHSITFLVNDAPEVEDLGPSMAARVMVADFRERYDGDREDKQLYGKLAGEAAGILAILAWGAAAWFQSWSAGNGGITLPQRVIDQSKDFMERNDPVAHCLEEAFTVERGVKWKSSLCYEAYVQWHARSDTEGEAMSQVRFSRALEKKAFKKARTENGIYWLGLKPKSAMELAEGEEDDE